MTELVVMLFVRVVYSDGMNDGSIVLTVKWVALDSS